MPEKDAGQSLENQETPESTLDTSDDDPLAKYGEKFKGKTVDDAMKMYKEAEQKLGEYDTKFKKLEQDNAAYEHWYNQLRSQGQPQVGGQPPQQQVPDTPETGSSWWDNPDVAAKKTFQRELQEYDKKRRYNDAYSRANFAESTAKQQYPDIFKGLDAQEVRNMMYSGVQNGILAPELLGQPESWAMAAGQAQLRKRNFKLDTSPNPEPTGGTEPPTAVKPQPYGQTEAVHFDSFGRELMDAFGDAVKNEKEAAEVVKDERKLQKELNK